MKIPGYKLLSVIATGGTATVYLGIQKSLGRKVAVKVINMLDESGQSDRFISEGHIIASLNHRNIITVHDVGREKNYHYIAMEYMQGGSLAEKIPRGIAVDQALKVMQEMGECLQYVHEKGLVHRDIKPGNILYHEDGTTRLSDFGIAKMVDKDNDKDKEDTLNSYALGSPYYVSPELVLGNPLDNRTDLYGLGIVFYEMLTGEKPFVEKTHVRTMVAHVNNPVPRLPPGFSDYQIFLDRLLAKSPEDRFSSAREMVSSVNALKRPASSRKRPRRYNGIFTRAYDFALCHRKVTMAAAALFVVSGIGFIGEQIDNPRTDKETAFNPAKPLVQDLGFNTDSMAYASTSGNPDTRDNQQARLSKIIFSPNVVYEDSDYFSRLEMQVESKIGRFSKLSMAQLENAAYKAAQEFKLTRPRGESAFDFFSEMLARDPANQQAEAGIRNITRIYVGLTRKQMDKGNMELASLYFDRGMLLSPGNPELARIGPEIAKYRENQATLSVSIANKYSTRIEMASSNFEPHLQPAIVESIALCPTPQNWQDVWKIVTGEFCPSRLAALEARAELPRGNR